jgi:hypothetical protein
VLICCDGPVTATRTVVRSTGDAVLTSRLLPVIDDIDALARGIRIVSLIDSHLFLNAALRPSSISR